METANGEIFYLGRILIEDYNGDVLLVNHMAQAAAPFFRAHPGNPLGLVRRLRFVMDRRHLVEVREETFDLGLLEGSPVPHDPFIAEYMDHYSPRLSSIAHKIYQEQYDLISDEDPSPLLISGGPGTGKTAIGLHRLANLI